jgi:hypothetical protein
MNGQFKERQAIKRTRHTFIYQVSPSVESFLSDPEPLDHGFVSAMYTEGDLAHKDAYILQGLIFHNVGCCEICLDSGWIVD